MLLLLGGLFSEVIELLDLLQLSMQFLHVCLLPMYHLLEVLQQVVEAGQVLLVLSLILGAQFQDNFEPLFLQQTLAELGNGVLLLSVKLLAVPTPPALATARLPALPLLDLQLLVHPLQLGVLVDDLVNPLLALLDVSLQVLHFVGGVLLDLALYPRQQLTLHCAIGVGDREHFALLNEVSLPAFGLSQGES